MTIPRPVLLAASLLAPLAPLAAQAAPDATTASSVALRPRGLVRVHTTDGARFYGRLIARTADSVVLSAPGLDGRRAVAWARVDTLWVQRGTAAVSLGIGTAAAFGAMGGFLAYGFSGGDYGPPCRDACVVGASVYGAGVGFLVGAAFGKLFPRWRRYHPAGVAGN